MIVGMPRRHRALVVALLALLPLAACGDGEPTSGTTGSTAPPPSGEVGTGGGSTTPTGDPLDVVGTVVADLDEPIVLVSRPGDDLVWVAERAGTVHRLERAPSGELTPTGGAVLDISEQTTTDMERGLLGMAFSVDGSILYLSYTDLDGASKVDAYDVTGGSIDAASRRELLSVEQPFPNHNGGHVVVTEDDVLWLGLGDGGAADDPENRAQDPGTLLGKLVKVDTSGAGDHEIVASGLRNPWRFSFAADGTVWIADVGQNAYEEINHLPVAQLDGANFGWSGYEGSEPYLDDDGRRPADPVMPVFTYGREGGNCSITGGVTVEGDDLGLDGAYLFADYCAGRVRALVPGAGGGYVDLDLGIDVEAPISFGTDPDGRAYVLSGTGVIIRIDPA